MKIYYILKRTLLVIIFIFNAFLLKAQIPTLYYASKFAIIANGNLFNNNDLPINGLIGTNSATIGYFGSGDSTINSSDSLLINGYSEFENAVDSFNNKEHQIEFNFNIFEESIHAGVYKINSDFILGENESLKLIGNSEDVFIINVRGNLSFNVNSYIILEGILPSNVFWNVTGNIYLNDKAYLYGCFMSQGDINVYNDVKGAISLFSNGNISINHTNAFFSRENTIGSNQIDCISKCLSDINLITDGNYNSINCNYSNGFFTDFDLRCDPINGLAHKTIMYAQNANNWNAYWSNNLLDHTTSQTGYFLLYDGAEFSQNNQDLIAWRKTITLDKGKKYRFSFYAADPFGSGLKTNLKIKIGNSLTETIIFDESSNSWHKYCFDFSTISGTGTYAVSLVISQTKNFTAVGTDFALDDFSLVEITPPSQIVLSNFNENTECVGGQTIILKATPSLNVNVISYEWYKVVGNTTTLLTGITSNTYSPNESAFYKVKAIFYSGCVSDYSNLVNVIIPPLSNANNYTVELNNNWLPTWTANSNPFNNASTIVINNEFRVKQGVNLKLKGLRIEFGPNAKLIIEEGAIVTLEKNQAIPTILTSYTCLKNMWQGVRLYSKLDAGISKSARLVIEEDCVIENARIGVSNYELSKTEPIFVSGYITANGAIFKNNYISVSILSSKATKKVNWSSFRNCNFICNASLKDYITYKKGLPKAFVELIHTNGIVFENNKFENSFYLNQPDNLTNISDNASLSQNIGISALNSTYIFNDSYYLPNKFINLWVGIDHTSTLPTIDGQKFQNIEFLSNAYGIILRGGSDFSIINNNFKLSNNYPEPIGEFKSSRNYIGINGRGNTKTIIKNNTFSKSYCGIISVDWSKNVKLTSLIELNNFVDVGRVNIDGGQGIYNLNNNNNLQVRCNQFLSTGSISQNHWVTDGIMPPQGNCSEINGPASNRFISSPLIADILVRKINTAFEYRAHNISTLDITPLIKQYPSLSNISSSYVINCNQSYSSTNACIPSNTDNRLIETILNDLDSTLKDPEDTTSINFLAEALTYFSINDSTGISKINLLNSTPLEEAKWQLVVEYINLNELDDALEILSILPKNNEEQYGKSLYYNFLINLYSNNKTLLDINAEDSIILSDISNMNCSSAYQAQGILHYLYGIGFEIPLPQYVEAQNREFFENKNQVETSDISIYPNPSSEKFTILISGGKLLSNISITDYTGRVLFYFPNLNSENQTISIDNLKDGVYFVNSLDNFNNKKTKKLLIIR